MKETALDQAIVPTVGVDVGGTFTDFVAVLPDGELRFYKEPSTPHDPSKAVKAGLMRLVEDYPALASGNVRIVHGTTIALNAVLQKKVADIALVVTEGTRDVLEIGRSKLPSSFNFHITKEVPIVARDRILEIGARSSSTGVRELQPDAVEIEALCARLRQLEVGAVAIMLLNSYVDGGLERELADQIAVRLPDVLVTCSSEIWPEIREFERAVVACINAQVHPLMDEYLSILAERIEQAGVDAALQLTSSSGGMVGIETAKHRPIDTILSGPASGATAAAKLAYSRSLKAALTFDMGGTSADIAVIANGELEFTTSSHIGELPLMMPVVDVSSIGAGGGSIVSVDAQNVIKVGPASAGANPGPVAYGLGGTQPTVTDCYLVLGILSADNFLGGRMRLDKEAARASLQKVADALGLQDAARAAEAAVRVATAQMTVELFKLLALKGHDPSEQTLIPFGGAGPTHSVLLAEEAGLREVVVPPAAATFCALGAAMADVRRDFVAALGQVRLLSAAERIWDNWRRLEVEARQWLEGEGIRTLGEDLLFGADMRYAGQAHNLMVGIPAKVRDDKDTRGIAEAFHLAHENIYGFREGDDAIEIVSQRLSIIGSVPEVTLPDVVSSGLQGQGGGTREVYHKGAWHKAVVRQRGTMGNGESLPGPAIVEQSDTTIWVPPGWRVQIDSKGFLMVDRSKANAA